MLGDNFGRWLPRFIPSIERIKSLLADSELDRGSVWWSILKNSGMVLVSNGVSKVVSFLATTVIARKLGPEQFGWYSFVLTYVAFVAILPDWGTDAILTREMARNPQKSNELLGAVITLRVFSVIVCVAGGFVVFRFLGSPRSLDPIVGVALLYVATFSFGTFAETHFRARMAMFIPTTAKVTGKALFLVLVVTGAEHVSAALILFAVVGFTIAPDALSTAFVLVSLWRRTTPNLAMGWRVWKPILVESWPLALMAICVMVYVRIDILMLSRMSTAHAVGNYAAAAMVAEAAGGIAMALAVSLLPVLSRAIDRERSIRFRWAYERGFRIVMFLLIPVGLFVTLSAEEVVRLVYGGRFQESAEALRLLIWAQVFASAGVLYTTGLIATGRQRLNLWLAMSAAVINVLMNVILIPRYGILGAAVATISAYGVGTVVLLLFRETRHYITPVFGASVIPVLASLMALFFARQMHQGVILEIVVSATLYLAAAAALYKIVGRWLGLAGMSGALERE